jgi:hypothetical protein
VHVPLGLLALDALSALAVCCILTTTGMLAVAKAETALKRPGGRHCFDLSVAVLTDASVFDGDQSVNPEAHEHLKIVSTLMVCMLGDDSCRYPHQELCRLGFRPKKLPRSAWTRDEILRLVGACEELQAGTAARSEAVFDWAQWIATYVFACTKDAYEVRLQIAKLASMRGSDLLQ